MKLFLLIKNAFKKANDKAFAIQMAILGFLFSTYTLADEAQFGFDGVVESGDSFTDVASNITGISETAFILIKTIAGLAGLWFVFLGVQHIRKAQDQNSGSTVARGVIYIIAGGAFGALPWLYQMTTTTVKG